MPGPNELDSTLSALAEGQRVFGRYTLGRVLGRGTLGVVWLARDEERRRNVELKFLPAFLARDVVTISDLRLEVERVQGLSHDAFQKIHDFHDDGTRAAVSSEFVPGNTLGALCEVRLNGCFDAAELLPWIEPLADAFTQAHEQLHLVHRALHPGHLVLTPSGRVKVLDFGIAHTLLEASARHAQAVHDGAAFTFSSPQLTAGALPVATDDIYALGATLSNLLTGAPAIIDDQPGLLPLAERRARLSRWGAPIPPAWEDVIAACVARNPAQRPQSVAVLVKKLRDGFEPGHPAESAVLKIDPPAAKIGNPSAATAQEVNVEPTPEAGTGKPAPATTDLPASITPAPTRAPATATLVAPIAATLPEVEAAQAISVQRAHHRGALVALICIGIAVWIARTVADRVLPPVLPGAPAASRVTAVSNLDPDAHPAGNATPAPSGPLLAATDSMPEPSFPVASPPSVPNSQLAETSPPLPATPTPDAPAPATPMPATPPAQPLATPVPIKPGPLPPLATPALPAPTTPTPATPMPATPPPQPPTTPVPPTPIPPPPQSTPGPKPATPTPATPVPTLPAALTVPTPTPPPPPPSPTTSTPGPRHVEPVPSVEPPKAGEPWTNSLGMPFVPVPKHPLLIAIWETRSRDFEVFAKAIALHWKPAKGGPDYPATDVSFLDAMLFCEWLTTAEEGSGRLKPGQHYRLPTDLEWSAAAGLSPERGETLRERDDPSDKSFPWGNAWPPPPTAGNFRGVNASTAGGPGDIFERAAPVGSFPPNRLGIFDMAGNVAELVSDLIAPELGLHATRGGSYLDGDRRTLRTRARGVGEDDHGRAPHIGFRVVLDPAAD